MFFSATRYSNFLLLVISRTDLVNVNLFAGLLFSATVNAKLLEHPLC